MIRRASSHTHACHKQLMSDELDLNKFPSDHIHSQISTVIDSQGVTKVHLYPLLKFETENYK